MSFAFRLIQETALINTCRKTAATVGRNLLVGAEKKKTLTKRKGEAIKYSPGRNVNLES